MNEEESMETLVLGAVRPPPESCDDRGKRPKQETESEYVTEEQSEKESEEESSDSEPEEEWVRQMKFKLEWDWKSHTLEEVKEIPLYITEERRPGLTHLSKLALDDYNTKNQDKQQYEFAELVKVTHKRLPLGTCYITFTAKPKDATGVDPSNCSATTFQAHAVDNITGDPDIEYCSIKT
ncbi:hypothetical protein QL285_062683 [Trifolium repens]|nr:hypothetical protein QL285_062683 [Trifolium repens]